MQEITLTLTIQEVETILSALSDQPFRVVSMLIQKVQQQGQEQLKPKPEIVKDAPVVEE